MLVTVPITYSTVFTEMNLGVCLAPWVRILVLLHRIWYVPGHLSALVLDCIHVINTLWGS